MSPPGREIICSYPLIFAKDVVCQLNVLEHVLCGIHCFYILNKEKR